MFIYNAKWIPSPSTEFVCSTSVVPWFPPTFFLSFVICLLPPRLPTSLPSLTRFTVGYEKQPNKKPWIYIYFLLSFEIRIMSYRQSVENNWIYRLALVYRRSLILLHTYRLLITNLIKIFSDLWFSYESRYIILFFFLCE